MAAQITDLSGDSVAGRTITFALGGGATANGVTNAAGVAAINLPVNTPPRTTTITASYAGTATTEAASAQSPFTVGKIETGTTVVANPPVVTIGDPVTFTATVTPTHGAAAGGSVQFNVDGNDFGCAGPAVRRHRDQPGLSTLPLGFHDVVAVYLGTADHAGSESQPFTFRVRNPLLNTSTTSSVSPGIVGVRPAGHPGGRRDQRRRRRDRIGGLHLRRDHAGDHRHRRLRSRRGRSSTTFPSGAHQVVATYSGDDVYAGERRHPEEPDRGQGRGGRGPVVLRHLDRLR